MSINIALKEPTYFKNYIMMTNKTFLFYRKQNFIHFKTHISFSESKMSSQSLKISFVYYRFNTIRVY